LVTAEWEHGRKTIGKTRWGELVHVRLIGGETGAGQPKASLLRGGERLKGQKGKDRKGWSWRTITDGKGWKEEK